MNPFVLGYGFSLFFSCLALHVILWRWRHPRRHALALLGVFFLPLLAFGAFFCGWHHGNLLDLTAIGLLHMALACAYIQIYPAVQAFSPTLVILLLVDKSMPEGVTQEELSEKLDDRFLLGARITDLVDANLIREAGGQLSLAPRGSQLIAFFIAFRRALGLGLGKG